MIASDTCSFISESSRLYARTAIARLRGWMHYLDIVSNTMHPHTNPIDLKLRPDKTDSGAECAMRHPLPTNPDGSLMSESKYRAEMERRKKTALSSQSPSLPTVTEGQKMQMKMEE
jgi:hypothetical protein